MSDTLDQEIRHLRTLYWSDRDPQGRAFAPLADACIRASRLDEAAELLQDGRARLPDFLPGLIVTARLHEARGNLEGAEAAFRGARELDPDNSQALFGLGRILAVRGEEAGVEMVERARALDPTVGKTLPSLRWNAGGSEPTAPTAVEDGEVISVLDLAPDPDPGHVIPSILDFAPDPPRESLAAAEAWGESAEVEARDEPGSVEIRDEPADSREADPGSPRETSTSSRAPVARLRATDPDEEGRGVTTRTLAELFVKQGLTDRAVEVYERLVARNPDDEELWARLETLTGDISAEGADARDADAEGAEVDDPKAEGAGSEDSEARDADPDGGDDRDGAPAAADDPESHVPEAPHPHPEDPTPFGWASTDDDPADPVPEGASIAAYLGRLLAFTPGAASPSSVSATTASESSDGDEAVGRKGDPQ